MAQHTFRFGNSLLNFSVLGSGKQVLLMFHGFGQDHTAFHAIEKPLAEQYTLYQFDLYFHGNSTWGDGEKPLEKSYWHEMLQTFLTTFTYRKILIAGL